MLKIQGTNFVADGEPVRLTGAAANHFFWNNIPWASFKKFREDVGILRDWGANFVVVDWNSGFLNDPEYIINLVEGLEYARSLGMRIELVLHSRGMKDENTPMQIITVNDSLALDWENLLGDSTVASRIAQTVDIYGILSEPVLDASGGELTWDEWLPLAEKICVAIRSRVGKDVICAISGTNWAGKTVEALSQPPTLENVTVEVHIYQTNNRLNPASTSWQPLIGKVMTHVGEIGYGDDPEFLSQMLEFITEHGLSFAGWAMLSSGDPKNLIDENGDPTPTGKLIRRYFLGN